MSPQMKVTSNKLNYGSKSYEELSYITNSLQQQVHILVTNFNQYISITATMIKPEHKCKAITELTCIG
jgi:hypothetical protein